MRTLIFCDTPYFTDDHLKAALSLNFPEPIIAEPNKRDGFNFNKLKGMEPDAVILDIVSGEREKNVFSYMESLDRTPSAVIGRPWGRLLGLDAYDVICPVINNPDALQRVRETDFDSVEINFPARLEPSNVIQYFTQLIKAVYEGDEPMNIQQESARRWFAEFKLYQIRFSSVEHPPFGVALIKEFSPVKLFPFSANDTTAILANFRDFTGKKPNRNVSQNPNPTLF